MLFTLDIGFLRVIIINLLINIMFLILAFFEKIPFKKIPLFGNPALYIGDTDVNVSYRIRK